MLHQASWNLCFTRWFTDINQRSVKSWTGQLAIGWFTNQSISGNVL